MPKANTKQKCTQHKYAEDSCSDNSDDDDSPPPPKKPLRQDTRPGPSVVLSDIESSPEAESATKRLSSLTEKVSIKSGKPFKDSSHQSPLDVSYSCSNTTGQETKVCVILKSPPLGCVMLCIYVYMYIHCI